MRKTIDMARVSVVKIITSEANAALERAPKAGRAFFSRGADSGQGAFHRNCVPPVRRAGVWYVRVRLLLL